MLERRRLLNLASPFFPSRACLVFSAADDWRAIKEEDGVPTFASVFSLHNTTRKIGGNVPISVHCLGKRAPGEKNFNRSPNNSEARRAWRVPEINRRMPVRMVATAASISARVEGAFS